MGFLKDLGGLLGEAAGTAIGGAVRLVGEATDIDFIKEVGDDVHRATKATGQLLGDVAEGAVVSVQGLVSDDATQRDAGLSQLGSAVSRTAQGIGQTVVGMAENGGKVVDGVLSNDMDRALEGARALGKTVAVGALAIGVTDAIVDLDADGLDADAAEPATPVVAAVDGVTAEPVAPPDTHFVEPHAVEGHSRADGTWVEGYWRDGDGDTSVDRSVAEGGGYLRGDPDGDPTNNLGGSGRGRA